jgi:Na+/melibiose symporter-like transporter
MSMTNDARDKQKRARRNVRKIALGNGTMLLFGSAILILFALTRMGDQEWGVGLLLLTVGVALAAFCLWLLKKYWS